MLAEHRDTPHPHAHLLLKLHASNGRHLDPRKADLAAWRQAFARAACREGVPLAASSCRTRGVQPRGDSRAVHELRRRGVIHWVEASHRWAEGPDRIRGIDRGDELEPAR